MRIRASVHRVTVTGTANWNCFHSWHSYIGKINRTLDVFWVVVFLVYYSTKWIQIFYACPSRVFKPISNLRSTSNRLSDDTFQINMQAQLSSSACFISPPSIQYSAIDRGHSVLPAVFCATLNWSLQSDLMRHFSFWVTQIVQTFPEEIRQLGRHSYRENIQSAVQQAALCQCQTVKCSLGTTKNVYSSQTWLCMVPHSSVKSTSASDLGMGVSL